MALYQKKKEKTADNNKKYQYTESDHGWTQGPRGAGGAECPLPSTRTGRRPGATPKQDGAGSERAQGVGRALCQGCGRWVRGGAGGHAQGPLLAAGGGDPTLRGLRGPRAGMLMAWPDSSHPAGHLGRARHIPASHSYKWRFTKCPWDSPESPGDFYFQSIIIP